MKCIYSSLEPPEILFWHHWGLPISLLVWGSDSTMRFIVPFFPSGSWVRRSTLMKEGKLAVLSKSP